jgi:hypothetical protein
MTAKKLAKKTRKQWATATNTDRARRMRTITVSDLAWAKLERIAKASHKGNRSAAIEALITKAKEPADGP